MVNLNLSPLLCSVNVKKNSRKTKSRELRIIGGSWRSRKVDFASDDAIRPTPDRIRETLFNWLQGDIAGARCLELYAGSGILSLEALSRGARHTTIIEKNAQTVAHIKQNLSSLGAAPDKFDCYRTNAIDWLNQYDGPAFDLLFLDPPFASKELERLLPMLNSPRILSNLSKVYIESPAPLEPALLPANLSILKHKASGQVFYSLCGCDFSS